MGTLSVENVIIEAGAYECREECGRLRRQTPRIIGLDSGRLTISIDDTTKPFSTLVEVLLGLIGYEVLPNALSLRSLHECGVFCCSSAVQTVNDETPHDR